MTSFVSLVKLETFAARSLNVYTGCKESEGGRPVIAVQPMFDLKNTPVLNCKSIRTATMLRM